VECELIVREVLQNPEWLVDILRHDVTAEGEISFGLHVVSQDGVYFFSTAIWFSIMLSAWILYTVDMMGLDELSSALPGPSSVSTTAAKAMLNDAEQLNAQNGGRKQNLLRRAGLGPVQQGFACLLVVLISVVFYQFWVSPFGRRTVPGSVNEIISVLLNDTIVNDEFSADIAFGDMLSLVLSGGGGNPFLQKDLIIFLIAGPIIVTLGSLFVFLAPLRRKVQHDCLSLLLVAFGFCGVDIFLLVVVVMGSNIENSTRSLLLTTYQGMQFCSTLQHDVVDNPIGPICLEIEFDLIWSGFMFMVALALLVSTLQLLVNRLRAIVFDKTPLLFDEER
jgi:hypothetical protein